MSGDGVVEAVVRGPLGEVRDVEGAAVEADEEPGVAECRERGRKRAPLVGGVADQVLLDLDPAVPEPGDAEEDHRSREEPEGLEVEVDVLGLVAELGREKEVGVGAPATVGAESRDAGRIAAVEGIERPLRSRREAAVPDEVVDRGVAPPGEPRLEGRTDPVDEAEVAAQVSKGCLGARSRAQAAGSDEETTQESPSGPSLHSPGTASSTGTPSYAARRSPRRVRARPCSPEKTWRSTKLARKMLSFSTTVYSRFPVDRLPEPRRDPPERYAHHRS